MRGARERLRDRPGQDGLGRPGHVLEQHVAAADERREDELDLLPLAVDDRLDVREEPLRERGRSDERLALEQHAGFSVHQGLSVLG